MKYLLQIFNFKAWTTIILDHFNWEEFVFVDPVDKFPRALSFVDNLLNFKVKE